MIRKLSVPQLRKFRDGFAEEARYGFGEVLLGWIEAVMGDVCVKGDVCVHDGPEALDGVQVWTICGKLDEMYAALRSSDPLFDGTASVIGRVVPNDVNG